MMVSARQHSARSVAIFTGNRRSRSPCTTRIGIRQSFSASSACQSGGIKAPSPRGSSERVRRGAERGEPRAQNQPAGVHAAHDRCGDPAAEREAKHGDLGIRRQLFKVLEGRDGIGLALGCLDAAGTVAVAGVVEDQRCRSPGCEQLLNAEPVVHGFGDTVADQNDGSCWSLSGPHPDRIELVSAAGDLAPLDRGGVVGVGDRAPHASGQPVPHEKHAADAGHGNREGVAVGAHGDPSMVNRGIAARGRAADFADGASAAGCGYASPFMPWASGNTLPSHRTGKRDRGTAGDLRTAPPSTPD